MNNEQLVEKLADRLYAAAQYDPTKFPHETTNRRAYEQMARECVRQMEWASRNSSDRMITEYIPPTTEFPYTHGVRVIGREPLTLAPPEWKSSA